MESQSPRAEDLREVLAGRYRLDRRIGAGGMATIYRARDLTLERDVAVKVLHRHLVDDEGLRERFRTEARHAARLLHPNVVNVFDTGERGGPDDLPWIVLEYVDGPSLRDVLRERGRLSPREALAVVEPVARALARAHESGLVHRDVKPENVLIAEDGTPKVADFGIARALATTSHTQTGTLIGSVHYMAPELVSGQPATAATDQYALGVLLYELLTGEQPLDADNPMAIALRHAQEEIPPPSRRSPDVPRALDRVVARATAARPVDRFDDLEHFAAALRDAVPEGPVPVVVHAEGDNGRQRTLVIPGGARQTEVVAASREGWMSDGRRRGARRPGAPRARGSGAGQRHRRATAVALAGVMLALLAAYGAWATLIAPPVEVPRLIGMSLQQARAALAERGVELAEGPAVHSRTVPEGAIATQDPAPGANVRRGGAVTVARSRGPRIVTMPKLVGLTEQEARDLLREQGFPDPEVHHGWHDVAPKGTVAAQRPDPGVEVPETEPVTIQVSRGIEQVEVPNVTELDEAAAAEALAAAKLRARFTRAYSDEEPEEGAVIRQSIAPGEVVDKGTEIEVVVSAGPMTISLPKVEGRKLSDAVAQLEELGLRVVVHEQARPRVGPFKRGEYGRVEAQSPRPGAQVRRGDRVELWTFSKAADDREGD